MQVYLSFTTHRVVRCVYWPPRSLPATSRVQSSETPQDAREASFSSGQPASNRTWSSTRRPSRPWTWAWEIHPKNKRFISSTIHIWLNITLQIRYYCFQDKKKSGVLPWSVQQSPVRSPQGCECSGHARRAASLCWKKTQNSSVTVVINVATAEIIMWRWSYLWQQTFTTLCRFLRLLNNTNKVYNVTKTERLTKADFKVSQSSLLEELEHTCPSL